MSTLSPNMKLVLSTVAVDSGLAWENNLNSSLTIVDGHNHTPGYGVQIPPAGLNISSNLTFQNNQATNMGAVVFTNQLSLSTLNALYTINGELWFNDPTQPVQITSGGAVNATSSGIASGTATAAFSGGVLVVNAASNTPANIEGGSILLGNNVANSKFLTLSPPASMATNITETLPTIPSATSFMQMDTSGNMSANVAVSAGITGANIASATVTRANQVAVGQQISSSSGTFTSTSSALTAVTNLSVTITTSGRPVMLMLQSAGAAGQASMGKYESGSGDCGFEYAFYRGGSPLALYFATGQSGPDAALQTPSGNCAMYLDVVAAGTYTYAFYMGTSGTGTVACNGMVLVAYEL